MLPSCLQKAPMVLHGFFYQIPKVFPNIFLKGTIENNTRNSYPTMVSTFMGRNWASTQHRKQAKGTSQHICCRNHFNATIEYAYILKLKAKIHDFKTLELNT